MIYKIFFIASFLVLAGCAAKTSFEKMEERNSSAKPRAAAYAAEGFILNNSYRTPEPRPYQPWDFYYKHCTLVSRNPFPTQAEYACSDPE